MLFCCSVYFTLSTRKTYGNSWFFNASQKLKTFQNHSRTYEQTNEILSIFLIRNRNFTLHYFLNQNSLWPKWKFQKFWKTVKNRKKSFFIQNFQISEEIFPAIFIQNVVTFDQFGSKRMNDKFHSSKTNEFVLIAPMVFVDQLQKLS